jgi:hypothetical protein
MEENGQEVAILEQYTLQEKEGNMLIVSLFFCIK